MSFKGNQNIKGFLTQGEEGRLFCLHIPLFTWRPEAVFLLFATDLLLLRIIHPVLLHIVEDSFTMLLLFLLDVLQRLADIGVY